MVTSVHIMNASTLQVPEIDFKALQVLGTSPQINQRELAVILGVSLGKSNYCVRALLAKGLIKMQNFKNSKNKLAYAYTLTPTGIAALATLTTEFLQVKTAEYERLRTEIEALQLADQLLSLTAIPGVVATVRTLTIKKSN
jgi:EPS-associated MarR family transcriptional regulator